MTGEQLHRGARRGRPRGSYRSDVIAHLGNIERLVAEGLTSTEIAQRLGIEPKKVQYAVSRRIDRSLVEQGRALRWNQTYREEEGCSYAQFKELERIGRRMCAAGSSRLQTPIGAFRKQRQSARQRGIEWNLTLWDWWTIWHRSGKWYQRGVAHGQYVMARHGDAGPYAVGNVEIMLASQNTSDGSREFDLPLGVTLSGHGSPRFRAVKSFGTTYYHIGTFDTPEEAHAAYIAFRPPNAPVERDSEHEKIFTCDQNTTTKSVGCTRLFHKPLVNKLEQ